MRAKEIFDRKDLDGEVEIVVGRDGDDTQRRLELIKFSGGRILLKIKTKGVIEQLVGMKKRLVLFYLLPDLVKIGTAGLDKFNDV